MWQSDPNEAGPLNFTSLVLSEVLYEFDGPKLFTAFVEPGLLFFVYVSDEDGETGAQKLLLAPTSSIEIASLKSGQLRLADVLDKTPLWVAERENGGRLYNVLVLRNGLNSVPERHRPAPNAMLWPWLTATHNRSAPGQMVVYVMTKNFTARSLSSSASRMELLKSEISATARKQFVGHEISNSAAIGAEAEKAELEIENYRRELARFH